MLMKNTFLLMLSLFSLVIASLFATVAVAEPTNLNTVVQQLKAYHDSGAYASELASVDLQAKSYLAQRIQENNTLDKPAKLALVLDIDETALSGYNSFAALNFGGTSKDMFQIIARANEPAIKPTLNLYRYAKANQVAVFFVTGRKEQLRQATVNNLQAAGYANWDGLFLEKNTYHKNSAIPYKAQMRHYIQSQGYTIVASIGDQLSDFEGGYTEKGFKLPNPYYYIA